MAVRPIDADAVKFSISGLRYIDPNDYFALAEYFMKQVKAMPTLTLPNEPLTMEQLREMDGEPVWLETAEGNWGLVDANSNRVRLKSGTGVSISLLGGIAYRRPPEGEEDA